MTDLMRLEILLKTDFTCTNNSRRVLIIGMAVAFVASIPLVMSGLCKNGTGHDMFFHLMRIAGLAEGFKSGQFPVRIQPGWYNGYGYATSIFYGDVFLWFPAALHLIGISLQTAYKLFVLVCNIATFFVAYFSFRGILKKDWIAFVGATWYTISLYRLINVYIRHAVGEHTAMIFFPLIAYALVCLLKEDPEISTGIKSLIIGMTGILQSHMISFEITVGVIAVICLIYVRRTFRKATFRAFAKAVGLTVLVNLWFLIPLFDYMKTGTFNANTVSEYKKSIDIGESGLFIKQLFGVFYGAAGVNLPASAGIENEMPLGVGLGALIIVGALISVIVFNFKNNDKDDKKLSIVTAVGTLVALFMSTIYFPWGKIESIHDVIRYATVNIQFPWRFLGVASAFLAFDVCIILAGSKSERLAIATVGISIVLLAVSGTYLLIDETRVSTKVNVKDIGNLNTSEPSGEEYLPYGTVVDELVYGDIRTTNVTYTLWAKDNLNFEVDLENKSNDNGYILAPLLYYKGYVSSLSDGSNETELYVTYGDNKRVLVEIPPKSKGKMTVWWSKPKLWWVGDITTIVTILAL